MREKKLRDVQRSSVLSCADEVRQRGHRCPIRHTPIDACLRISSEPQFNSELIE